MTTGWHIKGGRIVDPLVGRDEVGDLWIDGDILLDSPPAAGGEVVELDARGLVVVPGFIDLHVHLREPGNETAETVESGSRAAAAGGFTTIVAMPNTRPAMDSAGEVEALLARAGAGGHVRVLPAPCITMGRAGTVLADLAALARAGAVAFTDDGSTVPDSSVMAEAMRQARRLRLPVLDHALDPVLAGSGVMHEGERSRALGLPGIPSAAESDIAARDIALARDTGAAVHIQHVSCGDTVRLVREARRAGVRVTAEATPHHLALTDDSVCADNTDLKMSPPLCTEADRQALIGGLADNTIQALATDHAPHTATAKARGWLQAPFGVVGLETAVGVTYGVLVKSGALPLAEWVRRWTTGPASVLGLPAPTLTDGARADVAVLDLSGEWTVNAAAFLSKSRNTPFQGKALVGRAVYTFCGGKLTHGKAP